MAVGALLEPLTVVSLLFGGAWLNRDKEYCFKESQATWAAVDGVFKKNDEFGKRNPSPGSVASWSFDWSLSASPTLLGKPPKYRSRKLRLFGHETTVTSPNTLIFKDRLLSRVLRKFPFLVEVWYWALIYWVYQLGRAFTALTMMEDTVKTARRHALQVIRLERRLNIFREPPIQQFFLRRPALMHWINRIYSFIHIPGTILFLVVLYYLATVPRHRAAATDRVAFTSPALYEARRRAMAVCNLLAFAIFTLWPCMPPRLLSDPLYDGDNASEAKSYGFVDTVHGPAGESSVWTSNKFCNQHAAMPSLHFGYSLLVGLTIATLPTTGARPARWNRMGVVALGVSYPALILTAVVATANHFILDAMAGGLVCGIAWHSNDVMLNLCVLEDYFLCMVRIHKPVNSTDTETAMDTEFQSGLTSPA
ncbi:uncharacterized protein UV8b_06742 [Ustilaginoidea virens]|uniref:Inositolphosphotransferase Aur1/Ipt1 domain-containing protein n=1 Tax=Ustilaginoidea virens TaxID=1159556 RepID=A0A8E5MJX0_USTVR|nr:uncharacterized protein UV8b_06742 [Ustilaginoidea virens]QUC22501.1 hypothetical protein UV8b_06742 [Ustilaginoidea virens]